ncbi:MAG: type II toxin-antitoxin system RelE/ParE family toxin [Mesorhizobium sp.]|uniref:type II toxin-antitoxin system RelE/ParE family toxin n=1 Tax=Mesorhizobium sp. TaxID=1871066 RepID=UPI000FE58F5E|nr:type II toxin-antitoxin system RelE/ParE family toxin [Mesorhizobium sp.]RWM11630.1 MAG: type II toxin-antitoxin system RelE/ParE family toxin [Mesorhizobium sp.]TIO53203.1 MAG: type II toxin-antitoxin system RelE/ParE family toxin [Mesorhizobium sp.]TIO62169.1 MAG: type II toxin-antitoxin system RelE/ParE family toxin [Mesorhizobium sp.]TJV66832.1 MAG: type II toxin-antitoxin system RelE/ParE family toxin [Mesorhizobium sp.]
MSSPPIVRAAQAEEDLIAIWLYVAADNEAAADRLLGRIEGRWRQLAAYPLSGPPRDDIAPGVRHLIVGEYLTLYRVGSDAVEILRVLHGRRKIGADDLAP